MWFCVHKTASREEKNQGKTIRQKRNGRINGTDTETLQKEKETHAHRQSDRQTVRADMLHTS